jgi:hypothetical protein
MSDCTCTIVAIELKNDYTYRDGLYSYLQQDHVQSFQKFFLNYVSACLPCQKKYVLKTHAPSKSRWVGFRVSTSSY